MRVIKRGPAFLGDAVSREFADSLRAADLAEATRRGYTADLGKFRAWIEERRETTVALRRISAADLSSYRQHLIRADKLRAASVNRKVQALKRFFSWAEQKKLVLANPASALRLLRRPKRLRPSCLHEEEVQALLRAAGQTVHGVNSIFKCDSTSLFATEGESAMMRITESITNGAVPPQDRNGGLYQISSRSDKSLA